MRNVARVSTLYTLRQLGHFDAGSKNILPEGLVKLPYDQPDKMVTLLENLSEALFPQEQALTEELITGFSTNDLHRLAAADYRAAASKLGYLRVPLKGEAEFHERIKSSWVEGVVNREIDEFAIRRGLSPGCEMPKSWLDDIKDQMDLRAITVRHAFLKFDVHLVDEDKLFGFRTFVNRDDYTQLKHPEYETVKSLVAS